jgi:3-dehydroquinate synthase
MIENVRVELGERGYDIAIGERLLADAGERIAKLVKSKPVIIVTDETVARLYLHRLTNSLEENGISARPIVLPAGERTKSFNELEGLIETILEQKPDRSTLLIALGGGVIGDITGFAASIALRGIDFIQIPTTLLAQVDSAVGGKTAVNSKHGKTFISPNW